MPNPIPRDALKRKLDHHEKIVLIEALPAKYFQQGHLPGAINIAPDAPDASFAHALPDKDAEIVVYCASATCRNSSIAAERLAALGYRNVREYHEGKAGWIAAGLPIESGAAAAA